MVPVAASAQAPLSAIEWLGQNTPQVRAGPVLLEPPVTKTALRPDIAVQQLEETAEPIGLVPADVTGLPETLWKGSDINRLTQLIREVPVERSPSMQTLLYTLLLSETRSPQAAGNADALLLARLDRLMTLGATDPVESLAETAGPRSGRELFRRWFDASLLNGTEDEACEALDESPSLLNDYPARIFCDARRGDWTSAVLVLDTAHALDILPEEQLNLLDRFLSPDIYDGAPPLPAPRNPDPLTFRLYEAIGERLPTASLPRAFANADLRDIAGWKAQIEAAERLTQIGALPPNRLLGLYTERRPAASGGVWDRVQALQLFETALNQNSVSAVEKTLPGVWFAMQSARLEVPFADLFAERLAQLPLDDARAREIVWRVLLLSPAYEAAAAQPLGQGQRDLFLAALAQGHPGTVPAPGGTAQSIADGFAPDARPPARIQDALARGSLGEAILLSMAAFDSGLDGNAVDLTGAIATFRRVGLEDTVRRACLQLLLLDRR